MSFHNSANQFNLPGFTAGEDPFLSQLRYRLTPTSGGFDPSVLQDPSTLGRLCDFLGVPQLACDLGNAVVQRFLGQQAPTGGNGCDPGFTRDPISGVCVVIGGPGDPGATTLMGRPVAGRFGAGVQPLVTTQQIRKCPAGMVLGKDNVCYDHLRKSDRKWNPGTKPLFTGGDRNAISRAARVAGKMKRQQKRLQKLGLLPKPSRSRRPAPRSRRLTSGRHDGETIIVQQD